MPRTVTAVNASRIVTRFTFDYDPGSATGTAFVNYLVGTVSGDVFTPRPEENLINPGVASMALDGTELISEVVSTLAGLIATQEELTAPSPDHVQGPTGNNLLA